MLRFTIILKNTKLKIYSTISWLIIALNFFAFCYLGLSGYGGGRGLPLYAAALLLVIFLFRLVSKNEILLNDSLSLSFSISVIAWIILQFYWAAAITFVLFLVGDVSRRKLTVLVFDDRIVYPSFPKRTIEWKELNNVVLKDGLLTIDLKNNKILQNEIASPASELDFNEFCEQQLSQAKARS